jgi:hypothetical protein
MHGYQKLSGATQPLPKHKGNTPHLDKLAETSGRSYATKEITCVHGE